MIFDKNFLEISKNYEYFLFDVWGVIHDGISAYPNAVEIILTLKKQNKKICFLSNAPRRNFKVTEILKNYGIHQDSYDFVMTSGEAVFQDVSSQINNLKNKKYFYIGPKKDADILNGIDIQITENANEADFAITTGFDDYGSTIEEKMPQITQAKNANLKLICANPDLMVVRKNGDEMLCAGIIAKKYLELNQTVIYYGKPYRQIYEIVHEMFNFAPKDKMLAIGDGLETDIKGANDFGIDSVLITSGILSNKIGAKYGQKADENKVQEQCKLEKAFPQFVISNL